MAEVGQGLRRGVSILSALRNSRKQTVCTGTSLACVRVNGGVSDRRGGEESAWEQGEVQPESDTGAAHHAWSQHKHKVRSWLSATALELDSPQFTRIVQTRGQVQAVHKPALYQNGLRMSSWSRAAVCIGDTCRSLQQQIRPLCTAFFFLAEQRSACHGLQTLHHGLLTVSRTYSQRSDGSSRESPLNRSRTAYYDILKVSPSASQSQIKTAYYKQCLIYHPDRNSGNKEASLRFAEISEAYTVLGNISLRRKYDRHILSKSDIHGAGRPTSRPQQQQQHQQGTARQFSRAGRKIMFDFDAFYQGHYGEQLQRERDMKARRERMQQRRENMEKEERQRLITATVVLLFFVAGMFVLNL